MRHIYAPWRDKYFALKKGGCIFCQAGSSRKDSVNFVIYRGEKAFVMLNIFPYTNAHVMVAPYRHVGDITRLKKEEMAEMSALVQKAVSSMKEVFRCEGFNIGVNQGVVAGAGFAGHIHTHVVGRWKGDTNFMTAIGDVRVTPSSLKKTFGILKKEFFNKGQSFDGHGKKAEKRSRKPCSDTGLVTENRSRYSIYEKSKK